MTAFRSRWDEWEPKAPTPRTDKSDKSPFGTFGTSSTRPISEKNSHSDPEVDVSPSMEGTQIAPSPRSDKSDKSLSRTLKLTTDKADRSQLRRAHLAVVPDLSDPEDIQVWLHERAAMREDSGAARVDADNAAFDELLWIWHAANPVEHTPGICAACGVALGPPVMALPDGAAVCDKPGHGCLIAYGNGRRMEAVDVLADTGIEQPDWWEL